jgi:hypothetical protein
VPFSSTWTAVINGIDVILGHEIAEPTVEATGTAASPLTLARENETKNHKGDLLTRKSMSSLTHGIAI